MKICNGLFTFLDPRYVDLYALEEDVLQRIVEDISRCYLIFHSSLKYLDMILSSFGDMILTRDSIVNLKTIVDHCPQNFEKHRKTIGLMVGPPIVVVYQESRPWRRQPSEMQCRFTKKLDFSPDKPSRQRLRANNAGSYTFGNAGNAFQIENPPDGRRLYSYLLVGETTR